jgi:hypothetical protein
MPVLITTNLPRLQQRLYNFASCYLLHDPQPGGPDKKLAMRLVNGSAPV